MVWFVAIKGNTKGTFDFKGKVKIMGSKVENFEITTSNFLRKVKKFDVLEIEILR